MRRRRWIIGAWCVLALATPAVAGACPDQPLGSDTTRDTPDCPQPCQIVLVHTTAFQVRVDDFHDVDRVPEDGYLNSYRVQFGAPNADQRRLFHNVYGGSPRLGLTVLRPLGGNRYAVEYQGPQLDVSRRLGGNHCFLFDRPVPVRAGWEVGMTSGTWAPVLEGPDGPLFSSRFRGRSGCLGHKHQFPLPGPGEVGVFGDVCHESVTYSVGYQPAALGAAPPLPALMPFRVQPVIRYIRGTPVLRSVRFTGLQPHIEASVLCPTGRNGSCARVARSGPIGRHPGRTTYRFTNLNLVFNGPIEFDISAHGFIGRGVRLSVRGHRMQRRFLCLQQHGRRISRGACPRPPTVARVQ